MPTVDEIVASIEGADEIDVSGEKIGAKGMKKIAPVLKTNETVVDCYFDENDLDDKAIAELASAMEANQCVTSLSLVQNRITCEGAKALAGVLLKNETLKKLDLRQNRISDQGAMALAQGVSQHKGLQRLFLKDNDIGPLGGVALAEAAERRETPLVQLDIEANGLDAGTVVLLKEAGQRTGTEINAGYQKVGFRATGYKKEGTSEVVEDTKSVEINGKKVFAAR